jgi:hypothetical protein
MRYLGVELHSDEEVKGRIRQFTFLLLRPFSVAVLCVAAAFYFMIPLVNLRLWNWDIRIVGQSIFAALLLFGIFWGLRGYVKWAGTMLLITNQRVIDVDRRGIFDRAVSEVPYESLSDVSYRSKGFIEMTAGIGTITFQMYSGSDSVSFNNMMNPAALHKQILELRVAYLRGTPVVDDPVEGVMNRIGKFSPTEQRALLSALKKTVPRKAARPQANGPEDESS